MTLTTAQTAQLCPTCDAAPDRYCAPLRCLCGHPACPAFASWQQPASLGNGNVQTMPARSTWADREESTWIDKL